MNINKSLAIETMNEYGKNKIPFLFIIDFDMLEPQIIKLNEINTSEILFNINGRNNYIAESLPEKNIQFEKYPVPFETYKKSFDKVLKQIRDGNTYLLNLTFPTEVKTNLTLKEIFLLSNARYKLFYKNKFVVFTPESFVRIEGNIISSYPMKGTINSSIPNAEEVILCDKKETAEHNTIIDLIRNDLSMISRNVQVEKYRYVEKIVTNDKSLLQVSSKITGMLEENYNYKLGEIIFALLPAGSISGAPKKKTVEIIKEAEIYSRGFYTGILGYYDGLVLDSAVMIRFIEREDGKYFYKSGGGITFLSDAKSEYQELLDKVYVPIT